VAVAETWVFQADLERASGSVAADKLVGFLLEPVAGANVRRIELLADRVELLEEAAAVIEPIDGQVLREVQVGDVEAGRVRVAPGLERVVLHAKHVAAEVTRRQTDTGGVGHTDVSRQPTAARPNLARDDRADGGETGLGAGTADAHVLAGEHPM